MVFTPPPPPEAPIVTIWVHGTKISECLPFFLTHLKKKVLQDESRYPIGLQKILNLNSFHYTTGITHALYQSCPTMFPLEHSYAFYWSGELNNQARQEAACQFLQALIQLSRDCQIMYGMQPKFIVIAHSHGGNVILKMPSLIPVCDECPVTIHKLILLACPVQKNTMHFISSPMFERVYSLHSHTDMIQIADMQGLHKEKTSASPLFSQRHFPMHPKLAQACIRWKNGPINHPDDLYNNHVLFKELTTALNIIDKIKKNRGLFHLEFKLLSFIRQLPKVIEYLDTLIDNSCNCPSHENNDIIIEL